MLLLLADNRPVTAPGNTTTAKNVPVLPRQFADSQPRGTPRINKAHPLSAGIADVWVPGISSRGIASGVDSSTIAGGTVKLSPVGLGFNVTSTGRRYSTTILNSRPAAWLVVASRDTSADQNVSVIRKDGTISPMQEWAGVVRAGFFGSQGNFLGVAEYGTTSGYKGKTNTFCGIASPSEQVIFSNGGQNISAASIGATIGGPTTNPFCIGATESGGEVATAWTTHLVVLWQGANLPTSAQLRALADNPWQVFESEAPRSYASAAAAATVATLPGRAVLPRQFADSQPRGTPRINRSNTFGLSLDAVVIGGNPLNVATGKLGAQSAGLLTKVERVGLTFDTGPTTNNQNSLSLGAGYNYSGPFTIFWYGRLNAASSGGYDRLFTKDIGGGAGNWTLSLLGGQTVPAFFMQDSANASQTVVGSGGISLTTHELIVITHDGVNLSMYRNGVLNASIACTTFPGTNGNILSLGNGAGGFGAAMSVAMAGVGRGAITAAQAKAFADNPWQLFEANVPRSFAATTASSVSVLLGATSVQSNATPAASVSVPVVVNLTASAVYFDSQSDGTFENQYSTVDSQANTSGTGSVSIQVATITTVGATSVSTPSSSTATITQVHGAVGATSVEANSTSTAAITRAIGLTGVSASQGNNTATGTATQVADLVGATSVESNSTSAAVISQTQQLVGATSTEANAASTASVSATQQLIGATSVQSATTPTGAVAVGNGLVGATSVQAASSTTGAITRTVNLQAATTLQSNDSLATGITGAGTLQPTTTVQGNSTSTVAVSLAKTLVGATSVQGGSSGTAAVAAASSLVGASANQSSVASTGNVSSVQSLTGATSAQSAASGTGALVTSGTLSPATTIQAQTTSTASVTVVKVLSGATTTEANQAGTGAVSGTQNLVGAPSSQANVSLATAITSATVHNLGAVVTVSTGSTATAATSQVQVLSGQASSGSNASSGVAISSVQVLGASPAVVQNTSSTGLLGAMVSLVGTINNQSNSTTTSAIAQIQKLVAAAVNQGAVSGPGVVGQVRLLYGSGSTQRATSIDGSIVIGALITIGEVTVEVAFDPFDVQLNSDKYAVTVSNEPYDIVVTGRRA